MIFCFRSTRYIGIMRILLSLSAGLALASCAALLLADQLEDVLYIDPDHPAIRYNATPAADPVARLDRRLATGKAKLAFDPAKGGYLPALLKALDVPIDSQVLVFSKTSIQEKRISPAAPRAIYFNDNVAVGYVQGGDVLELSALDPKSGIRMYTLDNDRSAKLEFSNRSDCLRCHSGPPTLSVPGLLVSSVHPRSSAFGDGHGSAYLTDHRTEFDQRWGGWYVTGTSGRQKHLGNNVQLVDPIHPGGPAGPESQNVTDLNRYFDTSRYLAPTSDLVALLVLEHQTRMTNLITRIGWDVRIATQEKKAQAKQAELNDEIEQLLSYMLFVDEAPLKEPVAGVSAFTKTFPERGPKDKQGRSLRDFDLKTRIFRYPLSYMIYTPAFDAMPQAAKDRIYQRLFEILSGKDPSKEYAKLTAEERADILSILRDTKPNLPAYFTATQ